MNSKRKLLIVGGTGFIGYHLAREAISRKFLVTSISTKKPTKKRKLSKINYIICDITKKKDLKTKLNKNFDYVVNLGGYVDHTNKKKTFLSHYIGCKNLANFFLNTKLHSFVQIGSSVEYGKIKSPHKENALCSAKKLKSTYGKAKLLATNYLVNLYKKHKFPFTALRLYLSYGPKQDINRFLPIIIDGCIKDINFPCSSGVQYRDFLHVSDVVKAILKSLKIKDSKGEIINIGTGKPKKIKDIILFIKKKIKGGKPEFGKIKFRKDEMLKLYPDIKKAKKILNWSPKISFNHGINSTINYYIKNRKI